MKEKTFEDIDEKYDLEIDKIVRTINKEKAKKILLQFPDGLKVYSTKIKDKIQALLKKDKYNCDIFIWLDSCFGACDVPIETERLGIDLIIQFGHTPWNFDKSKKINVIK